MPRQLTFDLPVREARGRGDFFVTGSNAVAMRAIDAWHDWPGRKMVLSGPEGSGKTHLARVWSEMSGAVFIDTPDLPDAIDVAGRHAVIENADRVAGDPLLEAQLFHLHNMILAEGGTLLLTARQAPSRWGIELPDLRSRMEGTPVTMIDAPDDALLQAVILKLFADRQVAVRPELVDYITARIDRSLASAGRIVAYLDAMALAEGRAVNRSLASRLLDKAAAAG